MTHSVGNRAAWGSAIQSRPNCCPFCDGRKIIKRGLRKNSYRRLQIYWCRDCGKYFSPLAGIKRVKYPPRVIARALCLYNLGYSEQQTAQQIARECRITVPRRTLSDWIAGSRSITTFHRLRSAAVQLFSQGMVKERTLEHQQVYRYKVHLAKLELAAAVLPGSAVAKVKGYLFTALQGDFPDELFRADASPGGADTGEKSTESALRSSTSRFQTLPFSPAARQNLANDLAALGLLMARRNKERHPSVQDFMLANDACTIACEVPVYLTSDEIRYYKSVGFMVDLPELAKPITGHIDVVQVRNGLIHLLDYKPRATAVDPVNQLLVYALALASRTRLPLKLFKCAWFDERDYFEFFPLEAVRTKPLRKSIELEGPDHPQSAR